MSRYALSNSGNDLHLPLGGRGHAPLDSSDPTPNGQGGAMRSGRGPGMPPGDVGIIDGDVTERCLDGFSN